MKTLSRGKTHPLPGLRPIMEERGLSGRQAGLICDVHYATVSRILRGASASRDTTRRLARGLKVSPEALMAEPLEQDDEGSIEDQYVQRFTMGGEVHDPEFEAALVDKKLLEFREAVSTDEAFRGIATELLLLGKARGRELA